MKKPMVLLALSALLAAVLPPRPCGAGGTRYVLDGVDIFGSDKVSDEQVREALKNTIEKYLHRAGGTTKKSVRQTAELRKKIVDSVQDMGGFARTSMERVEVGEKEGATQVLLHFEVVEPEDLARRMPFYEAPSGDIQDTSKLVEDWGRYYDRGWKLFREGMIGIERPECPAFYCSWGSVKPELKKLEDRFISEVPNYKELLVRVFHEDKDPKRRANALYLLAYAREDGRWLARHCEHALLDPDPAVREAAMNILNDMSLHHQDVPLPFERVVGLLEYPDAGDRERALAFLVNVWDQPDYKSLIVDAAAAKAVKILRQKHPRNNEMAHTFLSFVSGEEHGRRDYRAWEDWLYRARKASADRKGEE